MIDLSFLGEISLLILEKHYCETFDKLRKFTLSFFTSVSGMNPLPRSGAFAINREPKFKTFGFKCIGSLNRIDRLGRFMWFGCEFLFSQGLGKCLFVV